MIDVQITFDPNCRSDGRSIGNGPSERPTDSSGQPSSSVQLDLKTQGQPAQNPLMFLDGEDIVYNIGASVDVDQTANVEAVRRCAHV